MNQPEEWKWPAEELKPVSWHFYNTCQKFSDRPAQVFNPSLYNNDYNGHVKWFELLDRVETIACGFMTIGIKPKDLVGIMAETSPLWTQIDLALCCLGCISVTIFPSLSIKETSFILNDSTCRYLVVGNEDILDRIMKGYRNIPSLEKIIVLDLKYQSKDERIIGLSEILELGKKHRFDKYAEYLSYRDSIKLEDWYTVVYTSGSSGTPRGIVLTHFSIVSRMMGAFEFWDRYGMSITEKDVSLCYLPLAYIFDRASCQFISVFRGACIAYADSPGTILDDIRKYNPTWLNTVSILYEKIYIHFKHNLENSRLKNKLYNCAIETGISVLEYRRDKNGAYNMHKDFNVSEKLPFLLRIKYRFAEKLFSNIRQLFGTNLRFAFLSASGIAPSLLKFFYAIGIPISEGYGLTETVSASILTPVTACKPGYVGINANGSYSRIAPDGELEVSGAGIFSHYLNRPELTEESYTRDGWLKTGDIVEIDRTGYYRIVDHKKSIICTSIGKNIAPAKLKGQFKTNDCIDQIFFVGDDKNYITALIVPNFNYFVGLYEKEGIRYDKSRMQWDDSFGISLCIKVGEDFIGTYKLKQVIDDAVTDANRNLETFEKIKQYSILTERFSEQNGTMTPAQKMKKNAIVEKYSGLIDKMYA
ncbi:MAG TPA: AMP-binding protein [Spirochaetota bacterium]|nr:AMP-binding protein [Spirochaetota bacterium]HPF05254.1 AMP-binding protein [Spirochaetota bacterium]HPJ40870.1 AMP-binding protein [Spirochaetota bacterium]HPR37179.1 AMP-binding protein [Spirochaetota bacterium]HRX46530.1 AMP-binding protein [Spirochaetota bacterium]